MIKYFVFLLLLSVTTASAQRNKIINIFAVPDTIKAAQFYTEVLVKDAGNGFYGNSFNKGRIGLVKKGRRKNLVFTLDSLSANTRIVASGLNTRKTSHQSVSWRYKWQQDQPYKLLVTTITDSATHASFYTGYVFLPEQKQWKLLASFKTTDGVQYIKKPAIEVSGKSKQPIDTRVTVQEAWIQRSNGSWKDLLPQTAKKSPVISVTNHIDSTDQAAIDKKEIIDSKTDTTGSADHVYYFMVREGKGELVHLTDTVSVYYKGWLLKDGSVFDQTKDKPAKFQLSRLIKGWQLGLTHCRVGGKIRMIIPSGLGYSIRSRSKDIPPNSVLVFEVEVLEAKASG